MYWKRINYLQNNVVSVGLFTFLGLLLLSSSVFALNVAITPTKDDPPTTIKDQSCGSNVAAQFTITNYGSGGVLCWYYTNEDSTKTKLTSTCVGPSQTVSNLNAYVKMPTSGLKTVNVQLECFDFVKGLFNNQDNCVSSYDYSQAVSNKYSCGAAQGNTLGCSVTLVSRQWSLSCAELKFSVAPSKSIVNLLNGQSETIPITVTNQMTSYSITCDQNIGAISAGGSNSNYKITVIAPSTGSGTKTETVSVTCNWQGGNSLMQSSQITVNYQSDPCKAALSDARSVISDAQTAITNTEKKIQEATQLGADTTNATASLNKANSELSTAQTGVATAQSSCDSGDKTTGPTQANSAKTSATQAKTYATDALNSAQQSITTFTQKKTEASDELSKANSALNTKGIDIVNKAESVLNNATQLSSVIPEAVQGLDLVTEKANVNTARLKIDQTKNYIKDAQTALEQNKFDLSISNSKEAIKLVNEANEIATKSFDTINKILLTQGEAAKAILSAVNEISQTDEVLSKMNYVIKNVETYGVDLGEAKQITSTGQTNIDEAKDLLSQSKNRFQSGVSKESADKAIAARDKAAEPTNRLNRIVDSMSSSTQDALKKAYADAEQKIANAENSVNSAAGTFGATQSEVLAAQDSLAKAKSQLTNASSAVNDASSAEDLPTFLSKASLAFATLEEVNLQAKSAESHSSSAKMGLITKIVIPVAGAAGAAGGGFLFWRLRRKKKLSVGKVEKIIEKDIEKAWKMFCNTCNKEYSQFEKFCSVCGKKLRKLTGAKHKQRR